MRLLAMQRLLDSMVRPIGFRVVKAPRRTNMLYQHTYAGGYEEYRVTQIECNRRKLNNVWADETTLSTVVEDLRGHGLGKSGICHGARNGFEVSWLRRALGGEVIGTDISETATRFPHMHVWDFHDDNPDWERRFDFVYTNSLDQAMEPARALKAWAKQIVPGGRMYMSTPWRIRRPREQNGSVRRPSNGYALSVFRVGARILSIVRYS